jgi:hypothetical protein
MIRMKLILAALALVGTTGPAIARDKDPERGEAALAKILKDRVAGKPVSCLPLTNLGSSQIVNRTAIVYESGGKLYVNRPSNADMLSDDDILVTRTTIGELCRMDAVNLVSRTGHYQHGFVVLSQFVPYAKVRPKG